MLAARVERVAPVPNRLTVATAPSGVLVVDDTFNSNPAGARAALELLRSLPVDGRRVVVTPGMVELGRRQRTENEAFAGAAARLAATLVVVGRTNLEALRQACGRRVAPRSSGWRLGSEQSSGCGRTSARATPCSTRTTCPTTTLSRPRPRRGGHDVGQVAVLFGGPAPEHDVSILTGLQATRELVAAGRDVVAIYWTKAGAFVTVDPTLEAAAFVDGAPSRAEPLTLRVGPEGGFGAAGPTRAARGASSSTRSCSAPTAGRARTGRSRARSTSRAYATRGRPCRVRRSAWTSSPSPR